MKKLLYLSTVCMLLQLRAVTQPKNIADTFILKGTITGQQSGKLYLYYTGINGKSKKDSAVIKNGAFVFRGGISEPCEAYLEGNIKTRSVEDPNTTSFFIEPAVMTIKLNTGAFQNAVLTGSKTRDEEMELYNSKAPLVKKLKPLQDAYTKMNNIYIQAIHEKKPQPVLDSLQEKTEAKLNELQSYSPQFEALDYAFFATHPRSYVTAFNLRFYLSRLTLDTLKMYYNNLGATVQQSSNGKLLAKEIDQLQSGSPGAVAKIFETKDIDGNKLTLADYKGKYVLLDFWASWCIPCRHSNPHLKELFGKYHDKGLEIIGVSDDDHEDSAWRQAVAKDGIGIWHHVLRGLDFKKLQNGEPNDEDISAKFGIHSLPTKILIDKSGVIIGRYDKATDEEQAEMDKKIEEAIK